MIQDCKNLPIFAKIYLHRYTICLWACIFLHLYIFCALPYLSIDVLLHGSTVNKFSPVPFAEDQNETLEGDEPDCRLFFTDH